MAKSVLMPRTSRNQNAAFAVAKQSFGLTARPVRTVEMLMVLAFISWRAKPPGSACASAMNAANPSLCA